MKRLRLALGYIQGVTRSVRAGIVACLVTAFSGGGAWAQVPACSVPSRDVLRCEMDGAPPAAPAADIGSNLVLQLVVGEGDERNLLAAIEALQGRYGKAVNWGAGIRLVGEGRAAGAAVAHSASMPDDWWRRVINSVRADEPSGHYAAQFSRAAAAGRVGHIYYRLDGHTGTGSDGLDTGFFRLCDRYRIACFGTWRARGDSGINLPRDMFSSPEQALQHGLPLPVFTGSTANVWGERGHYNLGLSWRQAGMVVSEKSLVVPLRYRRHTGLSADPEAEPLADQPPQATFDVTLRKSPQLRKLRGERMQWQIDGTDQGGVARVAEDGSLTIEGITLASSERYSRLRVSPAPTYWRLVYTRQPRARQPVPGTPVQEAANWQHATDVGRINGGLAEADVVIDDLEGTVKVIYDCTSSQEICVAHEARVSPDGKRIVYSVGRGNTLSDVYHDGLKLPIREIPALVDSRLWIYNLETGENKPIPNHSSRVIDRQPEWLNNEKIVFASNRGNSWPFRNPFGMHQGVDQFGNGRCFNPPACVSQEYGYGLAGRSMQLWTMNIDGTDARNISPHEQNALAPAVMSNGDILYSCWNSHENKAFDAVSSNSNRPNTSKNKWWLCRTDGNGADQTVILNGHLTITLKTRDWLGPGMRGGEGRSMLRAIRSVAEIFPRKLAVSNYYRSNHVGSMGIIYGMDYLNPHVEGCSTEACQPDAEGNSRRPGSGRYVPSSLRAITPYGTDQDIDVRRDARGRPLGKAGYAAPLPNTDTEFLITHARGSCYESTPHNQANRRAMNGEPTCQKAIYRVKVPMVTDPFDTRQMELLAGGNRWQAWDGRAIATYQELMGKPLPDQPEPLDENAACYLQVVDARKAELQPGLPYNWVTTLYQQCAFQGCAVNTEDRKFHERNMAALTVLLPEMWDITFKGANELEFIRHVSNTGYKSLATLGSQPLQKDGSVKMRVPCETPILMTGTDANGMAIAHDSMLHSLRKGETRTCHGCHDGHSEERAARIKRTAVERFRDTLAYSTLPPMPSKEPPVTFAQVQPILEKRCTGCHKDFNDRDGLLYSRIAQDYQQFDFPWARKVPAQGQHTSVRHVLIRNPGRGYQMGERLQFQPGNAAGRIARVGPKGQILEIRMERGGQGYQPLTPVTVKTVNGKGARLQAMTDRFEISRPYSSKWVAKFARDSLLYWKCMGSRQDGRTDGQYNNDIDFGPAHESGATPEECRVIGRWIDTGIQHVMQDVERTW